MEQRLCTQSCLLLLKSRVVGLGERSGGMANEMMDGMERLSYEETLKKAGIPQLGRQKANMVVVYKAEKAANEVTQSLTWSPGHLFLCKLLFTTSCNAGACDGMNRSSV